MRIAWRTETHYLECQWSETGECTRYNPPWMQSASSSAQETIVSPSFLDSARVSPFGLPACVRSVIDKSEIERLPA
jgi:hypothetical protein